MGWRTKVRSIIRVVTHRGRTYIIQHHYILRIFSYIFSHISSYNDTIFYSFLNTAKHLLSGGKDHCVLGLQPRKWTDLQSAEGHKYGVHDVLWWCQRDRSETSRTKSRAAMAQWELEVNREMELSSGSCTWLDCVRCFLVRCWTMLRAALSLWDVLVFITAACERCSQPSLLNNTDSDQHSPSTNGKRYCTLLLSVKHAHTT